MEPDQAGELEAEDVLAVLMLLHMLLQPSMLPGICEHEIEVVWALKNMVRASASYSMAP